MIQVRLSPSLSPAINLDECDRDLRRRRRAAAGPGAGGAAPVAGGAGGVAAVAEAGEGSDGPSAAVAAGVGTGNAMYGTVSPVGAQPTGVALHDSA